MAVLSCFCRISLLLNPTRFHFDIFVPDIDGGSLDIADHLLINLPHTQIDDNQDNPFYGKETSYN